MSDKSPEVSREAFALRPVRLNRGKDEIVHYWGITFPKNPYSGCELYIRRCWAFGYLVKDERDLMIDVLDEQGDIIQEFPINRQGFEYLRRTLKFRREN